jgi:hypothetical protein
MNKLPNWLHVVSEQPPGAPNGHGITLGRILSPYPPSRTGVICDAQATFGSLSFPEVLRLRTETPQLPPVWHLRKINRWLKHRGLSETCAQIANFINGRPGPMILLPMADGHLFLAAAKVAAARNIPSILWIMDDWVAGAGRAFPWLVSEMKARLRHCSARAIARFAASKEMAKAYEVEFGGNWQVLCNGVESGALTSHSVRPPNSQFRIGFFGNVYSIQVDPLYLLCVVCEELRIEVIVYGEIDPELRSRFKGFRCLTVHERLPQSEVQEHAQSCHALYLPYSFRAVDEQIIKTSFPTKVADYVVTGRPVLVHAPLDSTIVQFCKRTTWGIPVVSLAADDLRSALRDLQDQYSAHSSSQRLGMRTAAAELDMSQLRTSFANALLTAAQLST